MNQQIEYTDDDYTDAEETIQLSSLVSATKENTKPSRRQSKSNSAAKAAQPPHFASESLNSFGTAYGSNMHSTVTPTGRHKQLSRIGGRGSYASPLRAQSMREPATGLTPTHGLRLGGTGLTPQRGGGDGMSFEDVLSQHSTLELSGLDLNHNMGMSPLPGFTPSKPFDNLLTLSLTPLRTPRGGKGLGMHGMSSNTIMTPDGWNMDNSFPNLVTPGSAGLGQLFSRQAGLGGGLNVPAAFTLDM